MYYTNYIFSNSVFKILMKNSFHLLCFILESYVIMNFTCQGDLGNSFNYVIECLFCHCIFIRL